MQCTDQTFPRIKIFRSTPNYRLKIGLLCLSADSMKVRFSSKHCDKREGERRTCRSQQPAAPLDWLPVTTPVAPPAHDASSHAKLKFCVTLPPATHGARSRLPKWPDTVTHLAVRVCTRGPPLPRGCVNLWPAQSKIADYFQSHEESALSWYSRTRIHHNKSPNDQRKRARRGIEGRI